jgi:hypothetical protein
METINLPALRGNLFFIAFHKKNNCFLKQLSLLSLILLIFSSGIIAQNIALNTTGNLPDTSAMLDVNSSNKGFLLPRMTTTQINAIPLPANGLIVYNTSINSFQVNTGTSGSPVWSTIGTTTSGWAITGNSGTNASSNFIGTSDNVPLVIKVNNQLSGKIDNALGNSFFGYQSGNNISSGVHNVLIGYNSGFTQTTAGYNTIVGDSAGYLNTAANNIFIGYAAGTKNSTGTQNSFIGYQSGFKNTTAGNNTFEGYQSGNNNTTGSNNTFEGYQAGYANSTGPSNTGVGSTALVANTTGSNNAALGMGALGANTTGSQNAAFAAGSLRNSTTAGENTALGNSTLFSTTTGSYNVAVGYKTGYSLTTAINNTMIGDSAGYANTAASNTFAGYIAGTNNTNGYSNTFIGSNSGPTNTTGTRNTLLGDSTDVSSAALTNATAIGYGATVTTSNSVVLGNGANVGIGTSSPANKLEINSGLGGASGLRLKQLPSGAILFMSSTNDVAQSNNNLYFDATNYRLGVGAGSSPNSTLQTGGSFAAATITKTANYTASVGDYTILCNTTSGAITISLPPVSGCSGRIYVIKKISSATNNVTVAGYYTGDTIDGTTTKTIINQYSTLMIQSDGTQWNVLSSF